MPSFQLVSEFTPQGDQQQAIDSLVDGLERDEKFQTLLGVTGSGKTFTMANVINRCQLPTLVMSPNKTLAAQLYGEFKNFFPHNAVEYFISYYDYYQPEAYIPQSDTYIEKQTEVNEEIDKLRLRATSSLLERNDVIIVASVSAIYGLGSPVDYRSQLLSIQLDQQINRRDLLYNLIEIQYNRNDFDLIRGTFRVRGDIIEVHPAYDDYGIRIELDWDQVVRIARINLLTGNVIDDIDRVTIYPAKHFITDPSRIKKAIVDIREEMIIRTAELEADGKLIEAQRIEQRTRFDLEMMIETGYCTGVENYSRYLSGREPGSAPWTLFDYFPEEFLVVMDESHVGIPQIRGMIGGDQSRKKVLINYGFRLPSALDNRPLRLEEWEKKVRNVICMSATPADYEIENSNGVIVEQIIRPTGLLDSEIVIKRSEGQIDDLLEEIHQVVKRKERVLVSTLTKRMAEDLTDYLTQAGVNTRYLHSDIHSLERVDILRDLRLANFDVLVGINILREGLDIPEVSLVAILDADKEGFLRSERSLMQTAGRASRNVSGRVIFYGDKITPSMKAVIEETKRRRLIQRKYNEIHNIIPQTIRKAIIDILPQESKAKEIIRTDELNEPDRRILIDQLTSEMVSAAEILEFEKAAKLRDQIKSLMDSD
ncbi:MAG: excinuclease ABC subunit UvrB [Candidatus Electryoneaceae bacterium]|nr:excinuclease ABC subunit UvrB [Candidatus Electryoneaceae bacterium]